MENTNVTMPKWMNYETTDNIIANDLSVALHELGIYYERSGGNGFYHFEVLVDEDEENLVNNVLDNIYSMYL